MEIRKKPLFNENGDIEVSKKNINGHQIGTDRQ